jgi:glycosyltransferase involved in cell wall biosynthesis
MRLAIIGTRGVPANYGGFETFAEQFGRRMVERGHLVTVYGRTTSVPATITEHAGMQVVRLPAPASKYLETVVHTLFSALHLVGRRFDIVYVCNSANIPSVVVLLLARKRVVLNVDGLEWKRAKWSAIGRAYYRLCARAAAHLPVEIVTDARVIQQHYSDAYGRTTEYFPYGTDLEPMADDGTLERLGLHAGGYILYVSRLEPENNAHVVIDAYSRVETAVPLVIVGDAPYASDYIASLHATNDPRVIFTGAIYGDGYRVLRSHAIAYIQATEVGGTHPALIEAMGYGNAIVANDVPEHREVLGDAGWYYKSAAELAERIRAVLADDAARGRLAAAARVRAAERYAWDAVTDAYENWLQRLLSN